MAGTPTHIPGRLPDGIPPLEHLDPGSVVPPVFSAHKDPSHGVQ